MLYAKTNGNARASQKAPNKKILAAKMATKKATPKRKRIVVNTKYLEVVEAAQGQTRPPEMFAQTGCRPATIPVA